MTVREAVAWATTRLARMSESASSDAARLLCHVLNCERSWPLAHPEAVLDEAMGERFSALVERASTGEPLPYLLGRWPFYDRDFIVTPDVLIPRPETELLLEAALAFTAYRPVIAADVGTGSGALAVTFAANRRASRVIAIDKSAAAIVVARQNAAVHNVTIEFIEGDLLTPLIERAQQVDLVMANLPYIATNDLKTLAVSLHEPNLALDGGADGLDLVRRLLVTLPDILAADGLALLEIGAGQKESVLAFVASTLPAWSATVMPDYAGHDRLVQIRRMTAV